MKFALAIAATVFAALTSAAVIDPRNNGTCYTVHSGYLTVWADSKSQAVQIDSKKNVVWGTSDKKLKVNFQSCPKLLANYPDDDQWVGRIKVGSGCLTVSNPNGADPHYAKVSPCQTNTEPPQSQLWQYGTSDDRGVVWWRSPSEGFVGYQLNDDNQPATKAKTHQLEIGCTNSCSNFNIIADLS